MSLTQWLQQFFKEEFITPAESSAPQHPDWPDGTIYDPAKPWWVEETGETYETVDDAVEAMDGQLPSYASFGMIKFDP